MRRPLWREMRKHLWAYVFVAPMLVPFLAFTVYPLLASAYYTLFEWDGIGAQRSFVGLQNYASIVSDSFFWNAFVNTFVYALVVVPVELLLALALAVALDSPSLKSRSIFRFAFFSPIVTSPAVIGIVLAIAAVALGDTMSHVLMGVGLLDRPVDLLGDPHVVLWLIIAVGVWLGLGYPMVYFLAALQTVDKRLYDAARVDGAGNTAMLRHITLPLVRPVALIVLLVTTLHCLRVFDTVQVMTGGGPYFASDVVSTYVYRQAFFVTATGDSGARLGLASAAAFFMGLIVMGISISLFALIRRAARDRGLGHDD